MISEQEIRQILRDGEKLKVEFKKSQHELARTVYESICAFLNRCGGYVVLGADNHGNLVGIDSDCIQQQLDILVKDMNNPQLFRPTAYIEFQEMVLDGKHIIVGYVPESNQAHTYLGEYYDRNRDGDFILRSTELIANLFIRKSRMHTEEQVFPYLTMEDLDPAAFEYLRKQVFIKNQNHEWLSMTNEGIINSAELIGTDPETGKQGLTLAAILLFGKKSAIARVLPAYKTDMLCRMRDTELYDDRDQLQCNLMEAYQRAMAFIEKHLSEVPFIEHMVRFSLRDKILREVVLNMLIHREYSSAFPATFTIWNDRVETENWNLPYQYGNITIENLRPHAKNPHIAKVFAQTGLVEEIGSGTRKICKYTPIYSGGRSAEIIDDDVFKIIVPHPDKMEERKSSRNQVGTKSGPSRDQVGTKLGLSGDQVRILFEKMVQAVSAADLRDSLGFTNHTKFKNNILQPLIDDGLVSMTRPEKLTSPQQKYYLTEKGKTLLLN